MRQSRFTEERIVMALRQADAGTPAAGVCRKLDVTELRELMQLKEENRGLKGLVADLKLDRSILQEALRK